MKKLKLYKIEFTPVWPVPHGLIILAEDDIECMEIIDKTITHDAGNIVIVECDSSKSGVVWYESGEY